jgi:hypothetical protein
VKSNTGETLYKRITMKIFAPQTDKPHIQVIKASPGSLLGKQHIADLLAAASLEIRDAFPTHQYKLIQRTPNEFTFVPTGVRIPAKDLAQPA